MSQNIAAEAQLLLLSMATGASLMALYDILRIFRLILPHGWFWIGMEDLLYWLFSGLAVFYLLYRENNGTLRFYVIGTVLAAMLVYDRVCSIFFLKLLKKAGRCFKIKLFRKIIKKQEKGCQK